MKYVSSLIAGILLLIVLSISPSATNAASFASLDKLNLKDLTDGADAVVIGTVTGQNSYWNDEHTLIYTSVVLSVEESLKGAASQSKVIVTVDGGQVDGVTEMVSDMVTFQNGERAVVFLKKMPNSKVPVSQAVGVNSQEQFQVYDNYKGKFTIEGDKVDNIPLADFKGRVSNIVRGAPMSTTDLLVTPTVSTAYYLLTGQSWPPPPAPVVPYRINENCPDCTGEGTAVQNAAATWSNADAEFSFSYAGSTAATAVGYDGVNEVMWNNTIPVGIVARCWWWHYGSTTVESDIEFNDDYLWSASPTCPTGRFDVESVALHELGHTVGLADLYSGDTSRVMYGIIDYGQIKRTLHPDDIAGIQALYGTLIPAIPALNTPLNKATVADLEPTLTWNSSSKADDYGLQVANEPGFTAPFINEIGLTSLNYNLTGLNWNTNYYWRVNAHNSYGTSAWSAQRYFMTPLGPPPTDLTGTPISSSRIDLGWTDTTTGEAGFMIERKKGAAGTYALVATVGPDVTSYSNASGLLPSTEYYYRVRAYLSTKYTGYSNDTSATTLPPPPPVPTLTSPPSNAIVPGLTATLSWNPSTGAEDYGLQVSRNYSFTDLILTQTDIPATSYDVGGLNYQAVYYWRVNAQNSYDSTSRWSAYRIFRTPLGLPPTDLAATAISSTRIDLGWTDTTTGEAGFKIERKKGVTGTYALIASVGPNITSYSNISGLLPNTEYYYRVRAYRSALYTVYSNEASATTLPPPPPMPTLTSPPSNAIVPGLTATLSWNPSTGAEDYGLQVSRNYTFASLVVSQTDIAATSYDAGGLDPGTMYYWRVNAQNSSGSTSRWSAYRYFRTAAGP